ncbi:hypothetical protein PMZ80_005545 [Knufia obscura]|uniref:Uncharacterized protein n=2 Tax=Knufia TaxID=430999 RepID=A0AAN8I381_9EURO|nr:hypothetical protein PMZ80_005545 [Knufia obscura]KAK5950014.1 hypothetical protein OHC33_008975 [Knufia fluminis]
MRGLSIASRTWQRQPRPSFLFRLQSHRTLSSQAHAFGPSQPPLLEETIGENFARIVSQNGDRPAVISREQARRSTYYELDKESNILARGLQSLGVKKGDRVCVSLGNNIEFATLTYALFKLGAILVPLNPAFTANQIAAAFNVLSATHLIIGAETNLPYKPPRSNISILESLVPNLKGTTVESEHIQSLRHVILLDNTNGRVDVSPYRALTPFSSLTHDSDTSAVKPSSTLSNRDIINIQFTSGTTSMPKAACLSHRAILNNGNQIGDRMLLTSQDIVCCPPPLFHCFGCILGYMATATHGSAIVFPSEAFHPEKALRAVQEEKCTALYGVPTMFLAELELIANGTVKYEGFQYLRTGIAAGTSIPAELMRKLHKTLNLTELTICYGMTETSPVSVMTTTDDPIEKRINTVGRLMPHVEVKVVDPLDHSQVLEIGERGELAVSGYLLMEKYWGKPEKTMEVLYPDKDGKMWMHTGDEACMDAEGYVSITGRIKDLIIRGGENIHPLEIESCLLGHDGIRDASIVAIKDEKYGETVAAFVRVHANAEGQAVDIEGVRQFVRDRLSHHLVPKYVFFVDEYPVTASGKVQKFKLREEGERLVKEIKARDGNS